MFFKINCQFTETKWMIPLKGENVIYIRGNKQPESLELEFSRHHRLNMSVSGTCLSIKCNLTYINIFLLLLMLTSFFKLHLCIHLRFMSLDRSKPGIIQIAHQDWTKWRWYQCLLSSKLKTCSKGVEFATGYISFQRGKGLPFGLLSPEQFQTVSSK